MCCRIHLKQTNRGVAAVFFVVFALLTHSTTLAHELDSLIKETFTQPSTSPDSQAIQKVKYARAILPHNADSAILLAQEVLSYAKTKDFYYAIGESCNTIGWALTLKSKYDSSVYYLHLAREAFQTIKSYRDIARVHINLSECYTRQSRFAVAIQNLLEGETEAKKANDASILNDINRQLGIIYRETGDNQKSLRYLKDGMSGYKKLKDDRRYINTAISLAIVYNELNMFDSALAVLGELAVMARQAPDNEYQQAMIMEHLGNTWLAKNDLDQALQNFQSAYRDFKKIDLGGDVAYEAMKIGNVYVTLEQFGRAESYYNEAMHIIDSLSLMNYRFDLLRAMSKMYVARGDWEKAYGFLEESVSIGDSLTKIGNLAQTKELKERYETEKKEKEISLLKKDNEVTQLTLQKHRAWQYATILIIILLVLVGSLAVNRYRVVQRSKRLIEIEKMRNDIASDLHDDIGSTLSSLNIQSRVLSKQFEPQSLVKQNLEKIHDHTLEMMESISDIVWAINPKQDTLDSVIYRMKEFAAEVLEPLNITYSFNQHGNFSSHLNPRQRKNLYLVFKEAVNNAAKYAKCTDVRIDLTAEEDWITVSISDNGIGFDTATNGTGNGLKNMHGRAKELNGYLIIESGLGSGTRIQLNMPSHDLGMRNSDISSMLPMNKSFRQT